MQCILSPFCDKQEESVNHSFFQWIFSKSIYNWALGWCQFNIGLFETLYKWITNLDLFCSNPKNKKLSLIFFSFHSIVWFIWKARNVIMFKKWCPNPTKIEDEIQLNLLITLNFKHIPSILALLMLLDHLMLMALFN